MRTKYLLPCKACGLLAPVETSQAGESIECECGSLVEVPAMRQLEQLDKIRKEDTSSGSTWDARQSLILFGGFVAVLAGLAGIYRLADWPQPPAIDVPKIVEYADESIDRMPVDASWKFWYSEIILRGLPVSAPPAQVAYAKEVTRSVWSTSITFSIAGLGALVALSALFWKPAFWKPANSPPS